MTNVDVLIICALPLELNALMEIRSSVLGQWQEHEDAKGNAYFTNKLNGGARGTVTVAAAQANDMGGAATAEVSGRLSTLLNPNYLAMSGICGGLRGDSNLGDVVVANKVFNYEEGKYKAWKNVKGNIESVFAPEVTTFLIPYQWRQKIERMVGTWQPTEAIRPKSILSQARWVLDQLYREMDVLNHPEFEDQVPRWEETLDFMRKKKRWVTAKSLALTKKGRSEAEEMGIVHRNGPPVDPPFKLMHAPIASGSAVVSDPRIFPDRILKVVRKTIGLEMEGSAVGFVAHSEQIPMLARISRHHPRKKAPFVV